jgi:hypothetical protein
MQEIFLEAFIQQNSDYFAEKFKNFEEGKTVSWNWWAFFLPGIYLLYRKVYLWGFLVIVGRLLTMRLPFDGIFWGIIVGMFANYLLYKRYKNLINAAKKRELSESETVEFMKREGGVNKFFAVLAIIAAGYNLLGLVYIFSFRGY